jgi:hypothetical protein
MVGNDSLPPNLGGDPANFANPPGCCGGGRAPGGIRFFEKAPSLAELRNHVARNGKQPNPGPQTAFVMFDPGGFEPRPSSSNKRRFHVEVDHHGLGVVPRAITVQMPKPPQAGHQIPSLQLRRDRKREFGTSRDSQDRGPSSLVPEMAEGGYLPLRGREKRSSWPVKPTAKAKTFKIAQPEHPWGMGE